MRFFVELFDELDSTNSTNAKLSALKRYFANAESADAAWALHVLSGSRLIRRISGKRLRQWASEFSGISLWLIEESYDTVGDLSETLALLLPEVGQGLDEPLHQVVEERILPLEMMDEASQRDVIMAVWERTTSRERFLFHKLISGAFRVGVSKKLVTRAMAEVADVDQAVMAHRLAGRLPKTAEAFEQLIRPEGQDNEDTASPTSSSSSGGKTGRTSGGGGVYPFCLAHALSDDVTGLGEVSEWQVEWKWDGIRAQLAAHRGREGSSGRVMLWTRGEELVTDSFPELEALGRSLAARHEGVVIDGEILAWEDDRPLPFAMLQRRLGRRHVAPMLFADVPVVLMAYDLLEVDGRDVRAEATSVRRAALEAVVGEMLEADGRLPLRLSPVVEATSWRQLKQLHSTSRERGVEGMMLKRLDSGYKVGRARGDWWKWKVEPYTLDAVLVMAQRGSGRRAGLFTDYTFAIWAGEELVPVAKAYSGLSNLEIQVVDKWILAHTVERFGPVNRVKPELVFELGFEGIAESTRHKSGVALRFPRMLRQRDDKRIEQADTVETVRDLLASQG